MRRVQVGLLALLGCALTSGCAQPQPPPAQPTWPTLEPTSAGYNARVVALRTTLGRAAIGLEMAGRVREIQTADCSDGSAHRLQAGCAHCVLAGESDHFDEATLDAITRAFGRYPASFLIASHIEHVALCNHIEYDYPVNELFAVAGTVDYTRRRLFISVEGFIRRPYDDARSLNAEDIVHHELFHLIEFEYMRGDMSDPEWRLQNPIGFEYHVVATDTERPPGFVKPYATTNEIEDRASTYEYLMSRPAELCELARVDEIVHAKARLIWERVAKLDGDDWLRARATCGEAQWN